MSLKTLSIEEVMGTIDVNGLCWYTPEFWSDELQKQIDEKVEAGEIESARDAGISFMNADYCYIAKGNPRKVVVVSTANGKESWLEASVKKQKTVLKGE